jgi:hypothetical protein
MSKDLQKALRLATNKIPVLGDVKLLKNLDWACGDMAEAYRLGVQETQYEICRRIRAEIGKRDRAAQGKSAGR